ncbi:MAG: MFS transporter [Nocardioides sp.]|uniref:MFS transporter n=1 Tax=Nocardioides sp. TaxID=35761 RepID=UPI0039E2B762
MTAATRTGTHAAAQAPVATRAATPAATHRGGAGPTPVASSGRGRLIVLAALLLYALTLRTAVTSLTPLLDRIGDTLGFGSTTTGVFGMLPTVMFAVGGLVAPWLGRRLDLEPTAMIGVVVTALGIGLRAVAPGTAGLLLLSALALLGMGIGNVVLPPLVKRYFPDRVAGLSTAYLTCLQLGTTLPALITVPVADAAGWRVSLALWAIIPVLAVVPWAVILLRRGHPAHRAPEPEEHLKAVWRSPLAWGMAAMFGMTSLITYSFFTWIPKVLTDAGGSDSLGGTMVGLFSAIGFSATVVAPTICARMRNPFPVALGCSACLVLGLAGLLWAPMSGTVVWVIAVGLAVSTFPMALTLVNLRTRTHAGSASLSGFTQGIGYAAASAGPLLVGVLRDVTGGWAVPFGLILVAGAILLCGAWQACRPRYLEDTLAH